MKLTIYLAFCLSYYIAPPEFTYTIVVWAFGLSYLFSEKYHSLSTPKTTKSHVRFKSRFRYLPRRNPRIMVLTTDTTKLRSDLIRQQQQPHLSMPNNNQYCQTAATTNQQHHSELNNKRCTQAMGMTARHNTPIYPKLDTDSYVIAIDNCCSYSMSNNKSDFQGEMTSCRVDIKGIGGTNQITEMGTVCWTIDDDLGKPHKIIIPGTYYNPRSPYRLLSPQHWAQTSVYPSGTTCLTTHKGMTLSSKSLAFSRTVSLDQNTNCGFLRSTAGYKNYHAFMTMYPLNKEPTCFMRHFGFAATEGEIKTSNNPPITATDKWGEVNQNQQLTHGRIETELLEGVSPYNNNINLPIVEEGKMKNEEDELLRIHYKLGHLSFAKIRFMASLGWIEPKLAKCRVPTCAGCLYGKATRKPWRTKGISNSILVSSKPGDVIFIDQLTVTTPGLIGQVTGYLTHERYNYATVFLDNFSDAPYIVFQRALTGEETVRAKASFEGYASRHGVKISHYHTDNGIFRNQCFQNDILTQRQTISYCGVGAHHQNGRVEKLIRDIQDQGRTVLLHAKQRWPQAITENLRPYAYNLCTEIRRITPHSSDG